MRRQPEDTVDRVRTIDIARIYYDEKKDLHDFAMEVLQNLANKWTAADYTSITSGRTMGRRPISL